MKETDLDKKRQKLKPFREKIDEIDDKIVKLLGERFGVVRKVARIKAENDIPAFLPDGVRVVRERNVLTGKKYGIDADFIRMLYTMIIYQSCATEDLIKMEMKEKKLKAKKKA